MQIFIDQEQILRNIYMPEITEDFVQQIHMPAQMSKYCKYFYASASIADYWNASVRQTIKYSKFLKNPNIDQKIQIIDWFKEIID